MNKQDEEKRTVEGKFEKALGTISRGGAIILVGGFIAKGFGFIHQAFIAKYYGPSALGLLALALMWVTIATRFSTGGFPAALKKFLPIHIIKKDNLSFNNTVFTIFLLSLLFCTPFSILLFIFSDFIANHIFNIEDLAPILKIIAFVIPIHSLMVLIQQIFLSLKKLKKKLYLKT